MKGRTTRALLIGAGGATLAGLPVEAADWGSALIALALLAGLPHGALDHRLAESFPGGRGRAGQASFHLGYLLAVAVGLVGWWLAPSAGLLLLLLSAVWHFGESDLLHLGAAGGDAVLIVSRGLLVVGVPLLAHPEVAEQLFRSVVGSTGPPMPGPEVGAMAAVALVMAHLGAVWRVVPAADRGGVLLDALALGLLGAGGGPILGFAAYFLFWHTPDHFLAVARKASATGPGAVGRLGASAAPRAAVAAAGLGLLVVWVDPAEWARLVVWGVGALTLPHSMTVHLTLVESPATLLEAR